MAMDATASAATGSSIIRNLASCNKSIRDKALRNLQTWLPDQSQVSTDDMKLIWKGLFYCVWHSDKAPVQAELIDRLSSLLLSLHLPLSIEYFSVFLLTVRREWSGIDVLRLDKFYLLIRRFVFNLFMLMKHNSWDLDVVNRLVLVLDQQTLSATDRFEGNGVNYHITSVFLDEMKSFLPLRIDILNVFFNYFISAMGKTRNKVLLAKIKSNVFDVLFKMGISFLEVRKSGADIDSGNEIVLFGTIAVIMGFANKFYELGSSPQCSQGNRKVLFALHQSFLKLEKDFDSAGIKVSIPEINNENNDEDDEIPTLVPIKDSTTKKKHKGKKTSDGSGKKSKKKSDKKPTPDIIENMDDVPAANGDTSTDDANSIYFSESAVSNLQKQFEEIAAEAGLDSDGLVGCESPKSIAMDGVSKKRKRVKSTDGKKSRKVIKRDAATDGISKSCDKSAKKVKFSMKNNLVWKPQTPLPPQSLRLPASATPRGSALKQGVSPGPVKETVSRLTNNVKRVSQIKNGRKAIRGVAPATKRLKKLRN